MIVGAEWILVLAINNPCFASACPETVAITQVGPFASKELCLSALKFAKPQLAISGNTVAGFCIQSK